MKRDGAFQTCRTSAKVRRERRPWARGLHDQRHRSGRLTGHTAHEGYSNPSGRKHAHILKVWEVRSKKLGQTLQNCLIKLQSVNFISYIMEATEDFWEHRMQFTKYSKNQKDDCDDYCG